jgi:phage recombination protein Bet
MGNALATVNIPALQMDESELVSVLKNSLFPGATLASIKAVIGYCKAGGLDPLQKPVHVVPMYVTEKLPDGTEKKGMRDVVMPGIGLYRTQAARTGEYAGMSEPEFGPDVQFGAVKHPEWCRVSITRLVNGRECTWTAKEFWTENYATAGRDTTAPNAMWKRRPYGQLAKCAEAQALRKAFPEVGSMPTADELEGKPHALDDEGVTIDGETGQLDKARIEPPRRKSEQAPKLSPDERNARLDDPKTVEGEVMPEGAEPPRQDEGKAPPAAETRRPAAATPGSTEPASAGLLKTIRAEAAAKNIKEADLLKMAPVQVESLEQLQKGHAAALLGLVKVFKPGDAAEA